MRFPKVIFLLFLISFGALCWSQALLESENTSSVSTELTQRASIAMASASYPVTPGDQYRLAYSYRGQPQLMVVTVTTDYVIDLGIFGSIDATDLAFPELKAIVETTVNGYYPGSHPQLVIQNTGEFRVQIFREGKGAVSLNLWGLTRLGDIIDDLDLGDEYSQRVVRVTDRNGEDSYFDYYQYLYNRVESSNPYLHPGDQITFLYGQLVVEFTGAVREPGVRTIIARDNSDSIISYVGGFRPEADTSRVQKWQVMNGQEEYSLHAWDDIQLFNSRSNRLRIHVPALSESRNVMTVELNTPYHDEVETYLTETLDESVSGEYIRITIPVFEGMLVSDVLSEVEGYFTHMTDLRYSTIVRSGEIQPIRINLEDVMNFSDHSDNVPVQPGDVLGIPSRMVYVSVSGGVYEPGRYFYTPMQDVNYYITVAGGIDPTQNSHRNIVVYDSKGEEKEQDTIIEPGDNIVVVQDNMVFQFNQKFTAVTIGLTFITTLTLLITTLANGL